MGFTEGHIESTPRNFKLRDGPGDGVCVCEGEASGVARSPNREPERFL